MPELYDFQKVCVAQLLEHQRVTAASQGGHGDTSALIGDDMGLGKTVEAIALDVYRRQMYKNDYQAKSLVVTQTSVMGSWRKHYATWAPWLKVVELDRKNRSKFLTALKDPSVQVYICHWQSLRFMAEELKAVDWFHVIGDEIHNIKNRKAQQSQVFKKLRTFYKTGLSGTWADNRPDDAWSVLNWLWPRKFTSYWGFFNYHVKQKKHDEGFCLECSKQHKRAYTEIVGFEHEHEVHAQMGNAYVRRTKVAVWKDMPDKTWERREVDLLPLQRRTYDQMEKSMLAWVGQNEDQPVAAPVVISQLVRLQQFAVAYGKLQVAKSFAGKIEEHHHQQGLHLDLPVGTRMYRDVQQLVLDEPSSKLDAAMELIEGTHEQVVVFGQSKQAINLLAARLNAAGIPTGVLTGDTKQADRDQHVEDFQAGRLRVFLSTIKAGGVGITLTAASTCIFLDLAWSPSANRQAEDRLHRLGQKNAVFIIVLVARDTIDAARNDKIELKWTWLKQLLDPKERANAA
jgi:SNF2 family DNA or RNA helicase